MTDHPTFPIDIFEVIIDQASDHVSSLRQLSLICHAFQPRARYHLFSNISLRSVEQFQSAADFLDTHPWIPPLVRKVSLSPGPLSGDHWNRVQNAPLLDNIPVHVLCRLPNLRTWKLELLGSPMYPGGPWVSFHRSTLSCYSKYGGRIRALELSYIPFGDIPDFVCLISAFTSIRTIICSYLRFRIGAEIKPFVYRSGPSTLARPLNISHLRIGDSVDFRAVDYLLASSGATLDDLVLTLKGDMGDYRSGQPEEAIQSIRFSQLLSLTLIVPYYGHFRTTQSPNDFFPYSIGYAIKLLTRVTRPHLCKVRVEFRFHASSLAIVGTHLSRPSPIYKACEPLEEALLAFRLCRVSFHSSADHHRSQRAAFWSPAFKRAFPRLSEQGLLDFNAGVLDADTQCSVGHEGPMNSMVVSANSKWIATGSVDGTIIVWDTEYGTIVHEWVAHRGFGVRALSFSPDSRCLVSSGGDEMEGFAVWHIGADYVRKAATSAGHTQEIDTCIWSPDGSLVASTSKDNTVSVWDPSTFQQLDQVHQGDLTGLVLNHEYLHFSPDSQYLAWMSRLDTDGVGCNIWRPLTGKLPKWLSPGDKYTGINVFSFDPEGKRVATAHSPASTAGSHVVRIWDTANGTILAILSAHLDDITNVSFSPDGASILSASLDGSVKLWDLACRTETASLHVHDRYMESMPAPVAIACFSPDGKFVATVARFSSTIQLWRTDNASCIVEFIGHRGAEVSQVAFSPNGEFLASGDENGIVVTRRFPSSLLY